MRRHIATAGLLFALGAAAGCSSNPGGPLFNNEAQQPISCMAHQTDEPGARYTVKDQRNTGEILAVMKYYTAHGAKPYCDNAAATDTDKLWGELYVSLGGTTEKAATVLA